MTFGEDGGWGASPETSEAILAEYLDRGGNVVDTANIYTNGHSEKIVGDFFAARPGLRERVVLSTKFFANLYPGDPNGGGAGRKAIIAQLEESLRRLRTDYVDLYWLHNWDRRAPIEETLRALDDLVAAGKIRYVGPLRCPGVGRRAGPDDRPLPRLDADHRAAARVLAAGAHAPRESCCRWRKRSASGCCRGAHCEAGSCRASTSATTARLPTARRADLIGGPRERDWAVIETVARVADEIGVSSAEVSLAWVRNQPAITSTLIGARTIEQLRVQPGITPGHARA